MNIKHNKLVTEIWKSENVIKRFSYSNLLIDIEKEFHPLNLKTQE